MEKVLTAVHLVDVDYTLNSDLMVASTGRIVFGSINYRLFPKYPCPPTEIVTRRVILFPITLQPGQNFLRPRFLEEVCEARGLMLADPHTIAALNQQSEELADEWPNLTQWNSGKNFCQMFFYGRKKQQLVRWDLSSNMNFDSHARVVYIAGVRQR